MGTHRPHQLVPRQLRNRVRGVRAAGGLLALWLSPPAPNIAPEAAVNTRAVGSASRTASSSAAVAPAIAASVCAGFSHEAGTYDGAARW